MRGAKRSTQTQRLRLIGFWRPLANPRGVGGRPAAVMQRFPVTHECYGPVGVSDCFDLHALIWTVESLTWISGAGFPWAP